jgi:hypothetical protein
MYPKECESNDEDVEVDLPRERESGAELVLGDSCCGLRMRCSDPFNIAPRGPNASRRVGLASHWPG